VPVASPLADARRQVGPAGRRLTVPGAGRWLIFDEDVATGDRLNSSVPSLVETMAFPSP
jgi:hypothetical protein